MELENFLYLHCGEHRNKKAVNKEIKYEIK